MGTELTKNSLSTNPHEEAMLKEHVIPMKKLATTQEVVNAVLWLSSEEASHTTGQKNIYRWWNAYCIEEEKKMVKHVSIFALKRQSEIKHFVEMLEEVGKNYPLIIKK